MKHIFLFPFILLCAVLMGTIRPASCAGAEPFAVPTFHCIGLYWSPPGGGPGKKVLVRFREAGKRRWRDGLPMRYNPVDTPECRADYRGSIVNLTPGVRYEIRLALEGTRVEARLAAATWSENFPVGSVVRVKGGKKTLFVKRSGKPTGYVLYDGRGAVIDTGNSADIGVVVEASYVIIRGLTVRNVRKHGIRIMKGRHVHHIVIEDCDISKWGSRDKTGFGRGGQAGIFSNNKDLHAVVIQRCRIHHPSWDTNSWAEKHRTYHPDGPQAVEFWDSKGNHVIRYNEIWSDPDHYFNDILGAGHNGSYRGFPTADTDIYCNYLANCWDDGIEAEGGNQNVRIWNNYIENTFMIIGNAATSIGPLYVWRNVSGRSYTPPGSAWNLTHGCFLKMGYPASEKLMTGHTYVFNNTIFQPKGEGANGLGGGSKVIKHCVSRNNILHVRKEDTRSISTSRRSRDNDFDYDLVSARFPKGHEKHGIRGKPRYVPGAGFSFAKKTGIFQLVPGSPGYDAGVVIPNFCEVFTGRAPDMGAHEAGTPPMVFGVKAVFVSPGRKP